MKQMTSLNLKKVGKYYEYKANTCFELLRTYISFCFLQKKGRRWLRSAYLTAQRGPEMLSILSGILLELIIRFVSFAYTISIDTPARTG